MKQQFAHSCRSCRYRWFTFAAKAICPKCGSSRRSTFKLVPYQSERQSRRELIVTFGLLVVAVVLGALLT